MRNTIGEPGVAFRGEVGRESIRLSGASTVAVVLQKEEAEASAVTGGRLLAATDQQVSDSRGRSLLKAMSWRVTALVVTVSVVWVGTGEASFAAAVGVADAAVKIGLYYFHERAWNRLGFGRIGR